MVPVENLDWPEVFEVVAAAENERELDGIQTGFFKTVSFKIAKICVTYLIIFVVGT